MTTFSSTSPSSQAPQDSTAVFHYNAKFQARDGEAVPVRNFPLFYGVTPSNEGLTFGFQTISVSSTLDGRLLNLLGQDEFKRGLCLVESLSPVVGQLSRVASGLQAAARTSMCRSSAKDWMSSHPLWAAAWLQAPTSWFRFPRSSK